MFLGTLHFYVDVMTDLSIQATQSAAEDGQLSSIQIVDISLRPTVVLDDASEEEPEELFPNSGDKALPSNRESKKEREEKLKKMMEDDDADGMSPCASA